eukprot:8056339-Pyramimonas_sp.AAC.1
MNPLPVRPVILPMCRFAGLARDLFCLVTASSARRQREKLEPIRAAYDQAVGSAPELPPPSLLARCKTSHGEPMFEVRQSYLYK